jgi:ferredoxin
VTGLPLPRRTLLAAARRAGLLVGHPCRGAGVCGRCTVTVVEGGETLPPPGHRERLLLEREDLGPEYRIACQVTVSPGLRVVLRTGGAEREVSIPPDSP